MRVFTVSAHEGSTPKFSNPSGTLGSAYADAKAPPRKTPSRKPSSLVEWMTSSEATKLQGRWVLLSDSFDVIDYANSPSTLLDRHPDEKTPIIVFVDRPNTNRVV